MKKDLLKSYEFKKDDTIVSIDVYSTAYDDSSQVVWVSVNGVFACCFAGKSNVTGIASLLKVLGFEGNVLEAIFDGFFY